MPRPEPIRDKFADIFAHADAAVKSCPVEMGGAADLDLLYWIAEHFKARRIVETGVAHGWSSLALLLSLANRENACLVSTDMPYVNSDSDKYAGHVVPAELRPMWHLAQGPDRDVLRKALEKVKPIDLCHYDSDKSYDGRMWAYPHLWSALRPGGCFISDDIGDNVAFRDFCDRIEASPIVARTVSTVGIKYVGIIIKQ
jgi:predicted O-methyltransferase YrrM